MSQAAKVYYTPEEYLRMEENSLEKHEYFRGEISLMAGGSARHNQIVANTTAELGFNLRGSECTTYSSDMRIQVLENGLFTYGDVSVVCGKTELAPGRNDTILNPVLIVEVLSPSTEKYDRSQKFELYRGLESFQSYLLVDQERIYVEYHHKVGLNKWLMETFYSQEQTVYLEAPGIEIALSNLYEKVVFDS